MKNYPIVILGAPSRWIGADLLYYLRAIKGWMSQFPQGAKRKADLEG
jgi:hypothetical protein